MKSGGDIWFAVRILLLVLAEEQMNKLNISWDRL
jgi:hypothetical protein